MSTFEKLLRSMMGVETLRVKEKSHRSYLEHEGRVYKVTSCRRVNADDWFADEEWELTLTKPWAKHSVRSKVEWLDDVLMPRLSTRSLSFTGFGG